MITARCAGTFEGRHEASGWTARHCAILRVGMAATTVSGIGSIQRLVVPPAQFSPVGSSRAEVHRLARRSLP